MRIRRQKRQTINLLLTILGLLAIACVATPSQTPEITLSPPVGASLVTVESLPGTPGILPTDVPGASLPTAAQITESPPATATIPPTNTPPPAQVRFAVIGDFGQGNQGEADVAALIKEWGPDFIITVGDNNYPSGAAETIDFNIGQFYHEFIYPYLGAYGEGAAENRFYPTIGNHDWDTNQARAYFDYFTLPGNERYYDFLRGPVHFFALNSDSREPDGVGRSSVQAAWLQERLARSTAIWKVVYAHHPPYSSGPRGPVDWMRWPFKEWGATVYLAGHDHYYERLEVDGFPYLINGLGGGPIYAFGAIANGSLIRYNADYGALFVTADSQRMVFEFATRTGQLVDTYQIER